MQHNTSSESSFQQTYCESESEKSLRSDSGYLTEKSYQKPDFILKPHMVEVKSGGSAIFLCRITGSPAPSVVWETNGKTIHNDGRHKVKSNPRFIKCKDDKDLYNGKLVHLFI
jgi:hypothetical protein